MRSEGVSRIREHLDQLDWAEGGPHDTLARDLLASIDAGEYDEPADVVTAPSARRSRQVRMIEEHLDSIQDHPMVGEHVKFLLASIRKGYYDEDIESEGEIEHAPPPIPSWVARLEADAARLDAGVMSDENARLNGTLLDLMVEARSRDPLDDRRDAPRPPSFRID